ncbi:transmembrane emp24 domain-containing protein p24delta9-like [Silene latifolia]|uniref:transmembrane emp24 domain-containing protein p24delta9-like n=1 Tax=Silene latifolia TaxID=37657 RepID=UPI003D76FDC6
MIWCKLIVIVIIIIIGLIETLESLRFDLQSGHTKCISEDVKSNSMSVGKYHVVNPNEGTGTALPDTHKLTVRVTSPYGSNYHSADKVEAGHYAFTAVEAGDYMACFWSEDHNPPTTVTVDFDWKTGVAAKDWGAVAKKGSIDVMELELKKLLDTINSIHEEMFYLRDREEEMQALNRSTNSRMYWLSLLSLFICLSVAGLQVWHLKTFFERKKLL